MVVGAISGVTASIKTTMEIIQLVKSIGTAEQQKKELLLRAGMEAEHNVRFLDAVLKSNLRSTDPRRLGCAHQLTVDWIDALLILRHSTKDGSWKKIDTRLEGSVELFQDGTARRHAQRYDDAITLMRSVVVRTRVLQSMAALDDELLGTVRATVRYKNLRDVNAILSQWAQDRAMA